MQIESLLKYTIRLQGLRFGVEKDEASVLRLVSHLEIPVQYSFSIGIKIRGEIDKWFLRYRHSLNILWQADHSVSVYSIQLGYQALLV